MKEYIKHVLIVVVGVILGMVAYNMVKGFLPGNYEQDNFEVDQSGTIMQAA